ncbi:AAA family ATPase [Ornithinibacillus sp. L9]|uniref:AAA family ATPase n=1 Tax=Ornithinibacillus caprae TaxID=2678566 RepID=A0A6N8FME3_9BACI|nr:AAA family ATPase [Ornithinibacillus caprae]
MKHDQAESLRRQFEILQNPKQAKTISFVSGKGGVGKSNTALNFSLELCRNDKKVLLIDLDIGMGNIEILLGLHSQYTIVDMLQEQLPIYDIIETGPNNLSYISGGTGLNDIFSLDQTELDYFFVQYHKISKMYDFIVFDMGAGATPTSMAFVLAADECIVVTTPEPTSITDAYSMIKHIVKEQPGLSMYVLMNRSQSQKSGTKALERFQRVVKQFLKKDIQLLGILPDDQVVSTAVIRQVPYSIFNKKAAVSKALKLLIKNYISDSATQTANEPVSFIQKFKRLIRER